MSEEKLIIESRVKALLLKLPGVKSVGQEVLDLLSEGVRVATEQALASGQFRVTPGGRLLRRDPGDRSGAKPEAAAPGGTMAGGEVAVGAEWGPWHDWQVERRDRRTSLSFEEWKAAKAEELEKMTKIEQADKAERRG